MWGAKKIYASNDEVMEIEDIENLNSPKVLSKKHSTRIDDDSEIGNISRLGITGRRKRFPNRVKFSATHVIPAKIGTKLWYNHHHHRHHHHPRHHHHHHRRHHHHRHHYHYQVFKSIKKDVP